MAWNSVRKGLRWVGLSVAVVLVATLLYGGYFSLVYLLPLRSRRILETLPLRDHELPKSVDAWAVDDPGRDGFPIPAIIHQVSIYENRTAPVKWSAAVESCRNLHSDYEYILWEKENSRKLIAEKFPWFLRTWDSYRENILRADAIRYFALYQYGGIYLDLDVGCNRRIDSLRKYPAILPETVPVGYSNSMMMARPGHPLFLQLIHHLSRWNWNLGVRYATVMFSTGPMFLSCQVSVYQDLWVALREVGKTKDKSHLPFRSITRPMFTTNSSVSIFDEYEGNSWHDGEAPFVLWLGTHLGMIKAGAVLLGIALLAAVRARLRRQQTYTPGAGYSSVKNEV